MQHSIPHFLSAFLPMNDHSSIPSSISIRSTSIAFQTLPLSSTFITTPNGRAPLLARHSSITVGAPSCSFTTPISFSTPLSLSALPLPSCTPQKVLLHSCWHTPFSLKSFILPFELHFDLQLAEIWFPTYWITQNEPNDSRMQFHLLTVLKQVGSTQSVSSVFAWVMNCVFLHLAALISWEICWMTLRLWTIGIIRFLIRVVIAALGALIFEPLTIFCGSAYWTDTDNRMLNEMLGNIVWFRSW